MADGSTPAVRCAPALHRTAPRVRGPLRWREQAPATSSEPTSGSSGPSSPSRRRTTATAAGAVLGMGRSWTSSRTGPSQVLVPLPRRGLVISTAKAPFRRSTLDGARRSIHLPDPGPCEHGRGRSTRIGSVWFGAQRFALRAAANASDAPVLRGYGRELPTRRVPRCADSRLRRPSTRPPIRAFRGVHAGSGTAVAASRA